MHSISASRNGPCGQGKHGEKDMCKIGMLGRNVEEYQNLKINIQQLPVISLTEKYLLENRLCTEINESSVICPQHQDNQGIYWRPPAKISDVVLEEFKQDVLSVNMLFHKSNNAYCYHSNFAAEGLYHLCKQHGMQLLRYGYNEASKGKDQDRASAIGKTLLRNYVDAGNDLANANDIYSGLHYTLGVSGKVAVIDIDTKIGKVVAQEIPLLSIILSNFKRIKLKFGDNLMLVKELKCHILIPLKLYLEQ